MFRFFIPIILLGFALVLFLGYIRPQRDIAEGIRTEIIQAEDALENEKEDIKKKRDELKLAKNSVSDENKEKLRHLIPLKETFDVTIFVNDINNIVRKHGMILQGLSVGFVDTNSDVISSTEYEPFTMSFSVSSSYKDFLDLMTDIERSVQIVDVTVTSFSAHGETDFDTYNYAISLTAYLLQ